MIKKILFFALVLFAFSCETDSLEDENIHESKTLFPIVEEGLSKDLDSRLTFLDGNLEVFSLSGLDSNCNLTSFSFDNITNNVNWYDPNSYSGFNPYNSYTFPVNTYGELPSTFLTKSLTYILNDSDFMHSPSVAPPTYINPVTGNPYYQTVINNFYHEYRFQDYEVFNFITGEYEYEFLSSNMTPVESNLVRDIIACKLLEEANEVDPTAFIIDMGVQSDFFGTGPFGGDVVLSLRVWVKWGYHR